MQKKLCGGGHPLSRPHPLGAYGASIFALTALKLNVTPPPEKNPSYGLGWFVHRVMWSSRLFLVISGC